MENFKNRKLLMGLLLLSLVLIIAGATFAMLNFTGMSDQNLIKSGKVSMSYTESSNVINITNALPISDELGKNSAEYFDFTIVSNADTNVDDNDGIKIPYDLIIQGKDVDSGKTKLSDHQIKVYLTKVEDGVETPVVNPTKISDLKVNETNHNLYSTSNVHKNNNGVVITNYRLRAWIDERVDASSFKDEVYQYKFIVNVNATSKENTQVKTGAETLIEKVGTDGLVAETHPATTQLQATTDYRYTGADPNNYVRFNNELWRIIGVFDVDDGKGKLEKRIKITGKYIGNVAFDSSDFNDWSKATCMTLLNSGDYWNRTGSYASNGLTEEAKKMIADAKWYLGGTNNYQSVSNGLTSHFYMYERSNFVYSGYSESWTGKVALLYPSDYGYATSGGRTTSRETCLAKELYSWRSLSQCANNDWLFNGINQWTITPNPQYLDFVFYIYSTGYVEEYYYGNIRQTNAIYPTVYLSHDVKIIGGNGKLGTPYEISK